MFRLVEGDAATRAPLVARLAPALGVAGSLVTSRLTRLECRSKPLRAGDLVTLGHFDVFFAGVELVLVEVSPAVIGSLRISGVRRIRDGYRVGNAPRPGKGAPEQPPPLAQLATAW
jgi:hypothetical protein